ncbi:MAG: hypothetical protein FWE86_04140 [Oscillospiraceae bacterium]|nr:hypothetical protein [Oscillospiraceae bacterium]
MRHYKRLQVSNIGLRTVFEALCLIVSVMVCATMIVKGYERTFSRLTGGVSTDHTAQYAYSISNLVQKDLLFTEDGDVPEGDAPGDSVSGGGEVSASDIRVEYIKEKLSGQLDSCFLSGGALHSGAVYRVNIDDLPELFAQSQSYDPELSAAQAKSLSAAAGGEKQTGADGELFYTYLPLYDDENGGVQEGSEPYAVLAVTSIYRRTMEYDSLVYSRLEMIGWVCAAAILLYYTYLGIVSVLRKRKAVTVDD